MVFDSVFPGWSNPAGIAALVAGRFLLNASASLLVARTLRSPFPAVAVGATVCSLVLAVAVLRPGLAGIRASYVEALVQLGLVVIVAYAGYSSSSRGTAIAAAVVAVLALALLLVSLPLYGEATVAP